MTEVSVWLVLIVVAHHMEPPLMHGRTSLSHYLRFDGICVFCIFWSDLVVFCDVLWCLVEVNGVW